MNTIYNKIINIPCCAFLAMGTAMSQEEKTTFDPIPEFFQVISGQLNTLNPRNGAYAKVGDKIESYNAAGFNVLDKYAYAWGRFAPYRDQLVRIHADNTFEALGTPTPVGTKSPSFRIYAGDMDYSGNLWVRGDQFKSAALMKINVSDNTYEMVTFSGPNPGAVADLVYQERDGKGYFYGCRNQDLYIWDVEAKTTTKIQVANLPTGKRIYGAAYTDKARNLYFSDNNGGVHQIINYTTDKPRAVYLMASAKTHNNDGFSNPEQDSPIIVPENQAPTIAVEDDDIKFTSTGITINANVEDEGLPYTGDGVTVQWSQNSGPGDINFSKPKEYKTDLKFSRDGAYVCSLAATDGEFTTEVSFQIQVQNGDVQNIQTAAREAGDYKYSRQNWEAVKKKLHCRTSGVQLEQEKRGFNNAEYLLTADSEVIVTAIYDGGSFRNRLFWYDANSPNKETTIWKQFVIGPTAPLKVGSRASLGVLPAGTDLRFGLQVDFGRGGQTLVYQDDALNQDKLTQVAARLFNGDDDAKHKPMILAFEDQISGDDDFNDVIIQITILPQNDGITQLDNVIPEQDGIHSNRGRRGVRAHAERLQLYQQEYENTHQVWTMPNDPLTFKFEEDRSSMKFDFLVFDYDLVKHLPPGSLEFRKRAASNAVSIIDDRKYNPGASVTFNPSDYNLANKDVAFMIVPNNKRSVFLRNPWRYTPRGNNNRTKRQPLFSVNNANPGLHDQFITFKKDGAMMFAIEDFSRETAEENAEAGELSKSNFDNIVISITGGLTGKSLTGVVPTADVTEGWDGEDGIPSRAGRKCY